jgi:rubrerythrin
MLVEGERKLLELLEKQYNVKIQEITTISRLLDKVRNPLIKLYFEKTSLDVAKHASILHALISLVQGNGFVEQGNFGLSIEEIDRLRKKERDSIETYLETMHLATNDSIRLLIKDLMLDEDRHYKIVNELSTFIFDDALRKRKGMHNSVA